MSNLLPSTVNPLEIEQMLRDCAGDLHVFCRTFAPEYFSMEFSKGHLEFMRALSDVDELGRPKHRLVACSAYREFGKSTIGNLMLSAQNICFAALRECHYIVPVSCTSDIATERSEALKEFLTHNERVQSIFNTFESSSWAKDEWIAKNEHTGTHVKVLPRGAGQQIRGLNFVRFRPSLIIIDDVENPKYVNTPEQRDELWKWLRNDVFKAIARSNPYSRIVMVGSITHQDCVLARIKDLAKRQEERNPGDPKNWQFFNFPVCDENFRTLNPAFMSDADIQKELNDLREENNVSFFYQEMMGIPMAVEEASFREEYFKYYDLSEGELNKLEDSISIIFADLGKSQRAKSCNTALIGVTMVPDQERIYVRRVREGRFLPSEIYTDMLTMAADIGATILAPEYDSLESWIGEPLQEKVTDSGMDLQIIPVRSGGRKKENRIKGLQPWYASGKVWHNREACRGLEQQLLAFPKSDKMDAMDALAHAPALAKQLDIPLTRSVESRETRRRVNEFRSIIERGMGFADTYLGLDYYGRAA